MRKWEYRKIALSEQTRGSDDIDLLRDAGADGWELVAVLPSGVAYLKREVDASGIEAAQRWRDAEDERRTATEETLANAHVKPKYRDPASGETWSGRGRMASWLKRKVDAGEEIDKYLA